MPEFDTSHVKNIVLLGHAGSGKTTLAECMLFEAGIITRKGSIAERNTPEITTNLNRNVVILFSANSSIQNGEDTRSILSIRLDMMTFPER